MLDTLLTHLPDDIGGRPLTLFVADNGRDPAGPVLDRHRGRLDIRYDRVDVPGVSPARNHVLACARDAGFEFIACIDDDEWPAPGWLSALMATARDQKADIVIGPVRADLGPGDPEWLRQSGLLDKEHLIYGSPNLLLRLAALPEDPALWFRAEFARSGGSDWEFLTRLEREGARVAFAPGALVHEHVPETRKWLRYFLLRGLREGTTFVKSDRVRGVAPARRLWRALGTMAKKTLFGIEHLLRAPFSGQWHLVRAGMDFAAVLGVLMALMGLETRGYGPKLPRR